MNNDTAQTHQRVADPPQPTPSIIAVRSTTF
jgi:hypothetical protein